MLRRLGFLYDAFTVESVRQELDRAAASGNLAWEAEILARYRAPHGRCLDLHEGVQAAILSRLGVTCGVASPESDGATLRRWQSQWYNRRMGRKGTLWEERFKSVLVEGDEKALMTVAAYIDLNPVRAGMVERGKRQ